MPPTVTLTTGELFAGAGGLGLGFLLADHPQIRFQPLFAVDTDASALKTYNRNMRWLAEHAPHILPQVPKTLKQNVDQLNAHDVMRLLNLEPGVLDLLIGGPPCQGYSTSNRKSGVQRRVELNNMVTAFLNQIAAFQPKMFLIENVQGVRWTPPTEAMQVDTSQLSLFSDLQAAPSDVREFLSRAAKQLGYRVWHDILDAAGFQVPQHRLRFFLFGIQEDLVPEVEVSLSRYLQERRDITLISVTEAIGDLPPIENGQCWEGHQYVPSQEPYLMWLRQFMTDDVLFDHVTTKHLPEVIERYKHIPEGGNWQNIREMLTTYKDVERTHGNIYRRLVGSRPAHTVSHYRKSMTIHPTQHRGLSFREACRLQSFPDWFRFEGYSDDRQQQLANAVPPRLAAAVAWSIAAFWHDHCDLPEFQLQPLCTDQPTLFGLLEAEPSSLEVAGTSDEEMVAKTAVRRVGRRPGTFLRVERRPAPKGTYLVLRLGRGIWNALNQPRWLRIEYADNVLTLLPAERHNGLMVTVSSTRSPYIWVGRTASMFASFADGRYSTELTDGRIIVGPLL
ncbi:MAG: DNA cytosine methyltransferase [Herpetosiphonaceae bacterium]|nr:DNA cytosine methyltransferase [Herpetosiphonaceae bacterium]